MYTFNNFKQFNGIFKFTKKFILYKYNIKSCTNKKRSNETILVCKKETKLSKKRNQ